MAVACAAVCIRAAERTWTGGGGDAKWSTPANWGGTAPTTNDTLVFSGTAQPASTNDLADDTPFAGITFSGTSAFTLNGKRIILGGNVTNLSASAQTVNLPIALPETRVFNSSNGAITVNGALSGAGGLTKMGPQTLTLTASNSYDGVTAVNDGLLAITHGSALGSTNGNTVVYSKDTGGYLQLSGNIVVPEPLTLRGQRSTGGGSSLVNFSGSNTWSGPISRPNVGASNTRVNVNSGSQLNITGGVTGSNGALFVMRVDNGILAFYEKPVTIAPDRLWVELTGTVVIGAAGNAWGSPPNFGSSYTVRLDITNALPPTSAIRLGTAVGDSLTLNLNGFDQTVAELYSYAGNPGIRTITSATPATLTVNQSTTTVLDGRLTGALNLAKTGTGTLILSNSVANTSTTTGNITVSNGTLVVATLTSLGNSTNVAVAGGTLELRTASGIKDTASLFIADGGARVTIGDTLMETVDKLFLNGVQQVSGTWGTTASGAAHKDDIHFAGTGKLYVLTSPSFTVVDATWDGGGADTFMSTTNNWTGDALPAFNGTTRAFFGEGGATATVDTAVNLYGITVNSTNAFTIDSGAGTLTLGAGGVTAATPDTTSRTYSLVEDITLFGNQTWDVTTNGAGVTTLAVAGTIGDGVDPFGIIKSGNGVLALSGNNSYGGVTYLNSGALAISHANALGSTQGNTVGGGGYLLMSGGITVAETVTLSGDAVTQFGGGLRSVGGSNIWSGKITSSLSNSRIACNGGSLDVIGGIEGGQIALAGLGGTFMRVSGKPISTPGFTCYAHTSIPIILAVTNNVWDNLEVSGHIVRFDLENVLPSSGGLSVGQGNLSTLSGFDLNGNNQTVGYLQSSTNSALRAVFSRGPATLRVNQNGGVRLFTGSITGAVSLVKTGTGSLTLSGTSSTFGSYVVSNGTLAVSSSGTLGVNSTNVVVAGGELSLSNSVAIADAATLVIANGGTAKVSLAAGVNESVGYLYFGDTQQRAGTYSATGGEGVQVIDTTHFTGSGILRVLHDNAGTLISLR